MASKLNSAPAANVQAGPAYSHSSPATTLAASSATPLTRLNMPNPVPRKSAGAVWATMVASRP